MAYRDVVRATQPANLYLFWLLNETSGTVAAGDDTVLGQPGVYTGTVGTGYAQGREPLIQDVTAATEFGYSGDDGYVIDTIAAMNAANTEFTVLLWQEFVRGSGDQTLFHYATAGNLAEIIFRIKSTGEYAFEYQGGAEQTFADPAIQGDGRGIDRRMVCLVRDNTGPTWRLYINGVETDTDAYALGAAHGAVGAVTVAQEQTSLGAVITPSNPLEGVLQSVAFWNTELTPAEILAIYDAGKGVKNHYHEVQSVTSVGPAPVVNNFNPAASEIGISKSIKFDVVDAGPLDVTIYINYSTSGPSLELVRTPTGVSSDFTVLESTVGATTTFTVSRNDGWRSAPFSVVVEAKDPNNETQVTEGPYTVTGFTYPPNMQPAFELT